MIKSKTILTFATGFAFRSIYDTLISIKNDFNIDLVERKIATEEKIVYQSIPSAVGAATDCKSNESEHLLNPIKYFYETAKSLHPATDKVIFHEYQIMYGRFLLPYYYQNPNMKMLEIGLGCGMGYGPGMSVALHQKIFPNAELWEAEYDEKCVNLHRNGKLKNINVLTGDQGNETVLDRWIKESGGNFDVIIDDGGHKNCQIWNSLKTLWPTLKSGGLYFIEDLHVGKYDWTRDFTTESCDKNITVSEEMKEVVDLLIYRGEEDLIDSVMKRDFHKEVEFLFCQLEACVIGKK